MNQLVRAARRAVEAQSGTGLEDALRELEAALPSGRLALQLEGLRVVVQEYDAQDVGSWNQERDPAFLDEGHYGVVEVFDGCDLLGGERWHAVYIHDLDGLTGDRHGMSRKLYRAVLQQARIVWQSRAARALAGGA